MLNNPDIAGFKFLNKWLDGFLSRYDLTERHKITVTQHLPADLIGFQQAFLSYVLYMRKEHNYLLKYIANMDETLMWFDMSSNITINKKRKKLSQFVQ